MKFKNLHEAINYANRHGEHLYLWLIELRATCNSRRSFRRAIRKMFVEPKDVFKYWRKMNAQYKKFTNRHREH